MASRASATTWEEVIPFVADKFELEAVFRNVGIEGGGGGGTGPFEVAVELGIGRRPALGVSDKLLIAIGAEMLDVRFGSSIIARTFPKIWESKAGSSDAMTIGRAVCSSDKSRPWSIDKENKLSNALRPG
jgi:hypothetical protein